ncbi:MAG TPA: PAS domain S-box protein, partial [Methanocella sp.]|nr:PAS domain S-box protein [Methanocella sp.]
MEKRVVKKKGADKTKAELLVELDATRGQVSRLKDIVRRYERVAERRDVYRSLYDLEVKRDSVESLRKELREKQMEVDLRGEELEVLEEELRVQLEELSVKDDTLFRAEGALQESEARFRAVHENSLDRFTILKPVYDRGELVDFTYVYQNARAARTTGYLPEELVGRRFTDVWPTFLQTRFFTMYKQAAETGRVLEFEELYHADGVDDWFRATVTPVPDGIAISTQIITERKRAEESLRESEEKYRSLFNTMSEGFAVIEAINSDDGCPYDFRFIDGNLAYVRSVGLPSDQLVGRTVREINPNIEQSWIDFFSKVAVTGEPGRFEEYSSYSDRWIEVYAFSSREGQIAFLIDDITGRKRAEEALRESETRLYQQRVFLECLIENAGSGIAVLQGKELRYTLVNPVYQAIAPHIPMIGKTYREVFPEAAEVGAEERTRRVIDTGETWIVETYHGPIQGKPDARWQGTIVRLPVEEGQESSVISIVWDVTERWRAEVIVRESEQRLREAQRIAHIGSWEWNLQTGEVSWSPESYAIHGISEDSDALTPDLLISQTHPDDREKVNAAISRAISEGTSADLDYRIVRPDGTTRVIHAMGAVTEFDNEGKPLMMVGTNQDITDRKRVEEALKESEERFRVLSETSPVGIGVGSWDGKIVYTNPVYDRILGYDPGELIGRRSADVYWNPEERMSWYQTWIDEGVVRNIEVQFRKKDGTPVWVSMNISRVSFMGEVAGVGVVQDITERRKMEQLLKDSEELTRTVLNMSRDGLYRFNYKTGLMDYFSPAVADILGFTVEELVGISGATVQSMVHPDDVPGVLVAIKQLENTGEASAEYREMRKNGEYIWISNHMSLVKDDKGNPLYRYGNVRDITERKRAEDALRNTLQRFYTILSNMPGALLLISEEGRVEYVNDKFCSYFNLSEGPTGLVGVAAPDFTEKVKGIFKNPEVDLRIEELVGRWEPVIGCEVAMS